jgi:MSHA biogenesis protein MshM
LYNRKKPRKYGQFKKKRPFTVYLKHFGLHSKPFLVTPETEAFFKGGSRKNLLESVEYVLGNEEGIVKITGEVGSGKTTICRYLLKQLPAKFKPLYIADPTLSREQMLFAVADGLGVEFSRRNPEAMVVALQKKLGEYYEQGKKIVLMVDEAHAMPEETLDQIRLLSQLEAGGNRIMQVILLGPQELDHNLALPELRAVRDRIVHAFRIKRLSLQDIAEYLSFKMEASGYEGPKVFTQNAVRLIGRLSNGLPRRINVVADKALLSASIDQRFEVRSRDIASAAREIKLERSITEGDTWLIRIGSFFLGATAGILGLMFALNQGYVSVKGPGGQPMTQEQQVEQSLPQDTTDPTKGAVKAAPPGTTAQEANMPSPSNIPVPAVDAQSILSGVLENDEYNFNKAKPTAPTAPKAPNK